MATSVAFGPTRHRPHRLLVLWGALGAVMFVAILGGIAGGSQATGPSATALADIPANYLQAYQAAGRAYGLDWAILAGIGKKESDHGRLAAPGVTSGWNFCGAAGPMQHGIVGIPGGPPSVGPDCPAGAGGAGGRWASVGVDADGDGVVNVYAPADAIFGSANRLRQDGAPNDWHQAILKYNNSEAYFADVMRIAATYRDAASVGAPQGNASAIALASNPRMLFTLPSQRDDLTTGQIDSRIVDVLTWITGQGYTLTITSMKSDHRQCARFDSGVCITSAHIAGRAVDIAAVNGEPCWPGTPDRRCGHLYELLVNTLRGTPYQPAQIIHGYDLWPTEPWNFAMVNHRDHIHLGY